MDLWGRGVPLSLRREKRERFEGEGSRHPQANCGSQVTTGDAVFRDPVVGVIFTCVNDTRLPPSRADDLYVADSLAQPFQV